MIDRSLIPAHKKLQSRMQKGFHGDDPSIHTALNFYKK
jgi:hypothetical protein